jgi:hypothetical protein
MILLYALSAENGLVIGAVKMHDSVRMQVTKLFFHTLFILLVKIKVALSKLLVLFNDFIKDVNI